MMIPEDLYNQIIGYAKSRCYSIMGWYSDDVYMDVTHSVIADVKFSQSSWKNLVDRYVYKKKEESFKIKHFFRENEIEKEDDTTEKWLCKNCQEWLPKDCFKASHTLCGPCYYAQNKERLRANNKRWCAENKEQASYLRKLYYYRDRKNRILRNREWKSNNEDKIKEYSKRYYEKNKEKIAAYRRKYRAENKEKVAEQDKKYKKAQRLKKQGKR